MIRLGEAVQSSNCYSALAAPALPTAAPARSFAHQSGRALLKLGLPDLRAALPSFRAQSQQPVPVLFLC